MARSFSIYETKSRLSEILRMVKSGTEVTVLERGVPIAKLISIPKTEGIKDRLSQLQGNGSLISKKDLNKDWPLGSKKEGALKRFLGERE